MINERLVTFRSVRVNFERVSDWVGRDEPLANTGKSLNLFLLVLTCHMHLSCPLASTVPAGGQGCDAMHPGPWFCPILFIGPALQKGGNAFRRHVKSIHDEGASVLLPQMS